jgi:hypothetical protein
VPSSRLVRPREGLWAARVVPAGEGEGEEGDGRWCVLLPVGSCKRAKERPDVVVGCDGSTVVVVVVTVDGVWGG